jgi:hypothetical protein
MRVVVGSVAFAIVLAFGSSALAEDAKPAPKPTARATAASKHGATRADISVGAALARCDDALAMQGPAALTAASAVRSPVAAPSPSPSPAIVQPEAGGLADIRVVGMQASGGAGRATEMTVSATHRAKPAATVRMRRKMNVARTMTSLAPAFEACRALAGPAASGTVAVKLDVSAAGQVEGAGATSVTGVMAKPAVACVVAAFSNARFGAPGSQGASITVPVVVAPDRGDGTRVASSD